MELKRELGLFDAAAIGIGAIVGAGIFVITGIAAGMAGPALLLSLAIGAVIAGCTGMSFAELARFMPKEGGGYEFARELISPFAGFMAGWLWLISNVIVGAAVAIGFASYLATFLPIPVNAVAAIACLGVTLVNYLGAKESTLVNDILVVVKLSVLAFFVAFGILLVRPTNFTPFAPHGGVGVMQGAALIFFAYAGFARITLVSEEVRDAKKNVPKAIIIALVVSTLVYLLVAFTSVGLVGYNALASSDSPLADAAKSESDTAASLISIGALAATLGVLLITLLGLSRISFAMARNTDMPSAFKRLHPTRSTPYVTVVVFGLAMTLFASFSTLLQAAAIANFAALIYYAIANFSALRMRNPSYPRLISVLGLITCVILLFFLTTDAWIVGGFVLLAGALTYHFKNRMRSFSASSRSSDQDT